MKLNEAKDVAPPDKSCAFTGHRDIPPERVPQICNLLDRAIGYLYGLGIRDFYCGGALGFDTLAEERVLAAREEHKDIRLRLILPCKDQCRRWPVESILRYIRILDMADTTDYMAEWYSPACMNERNRRLVDAADYLVCYVEHGASGAAQTLRLAKAEGKTCYNLARPESPGE